MGIRKPSIKKSIKARTTGKIKRQVKSAIDPTYGKKGVGMIKDPKKAVYNKVYNKTTVGLSDLAPKARAEKNGVYRGQGSAYSPATWKVLGSIMKVLAVAYAVLGVLLGLFAGAYVLLAVGGALAFCFWKIGSAWVKKASDTQEAVPEPLAESDEASS